MLQITKQTSANFWSISISERPSFWNTVNTSHGQLITGKSQNSDSNNIKTTISVPHDVQLWLNKRLYPLTFFQQYRYGSLAATTDIVHANS